MNVLVKLSFRLRQLLVILLLVCSTLAIAVPPAAADCQFNQDSYECIRLKLKNQQGLILQSERNNFMEEVKSGSDFKYCRGCDLGGVDLSSANLSGAYLENAYLIEANLSGANLTGAKLDNALLVDANLSSADLTDANLDNAILEQANLKDAKVTEDQLKFAILKDTILPDGAVRDYPFWEMP